MTAAQGLNEFKNHLIAGKVKPLSAAGNINQNLKRFINEYLEHIEKRVEPSTSILYDVALNKALDCWGDISLSKITERHLDGFLTDMARSGLKKPTINKNYRHLKTALKKAFDWKYIETPLRFPKQLREQKDQRFLTTDQFQRLREILQKNDDKEFSDFCLLSVYTGMRSGELLRLLLSDVDNFELDIMRISSVQKNKKESFIPINRQAREILDRCIARAKEKRRDKIFKFNCRTHISQRFKECARAVGIPNARFHDLRHTFGSHMIMSGVDVRVLQKLMRHQSIQSTLVYADVSMEYLKGESNKLTI